MTARVGLLACFLPFALPAQTPASSDSGSMVFVIARPGKDKQAYELRIADAVVSLKSGAVLGTSNDSGYVAASHLPEGTMQLTFRAKDHLTLNCKVTVRLAVVDTIRVEMASDRSGAYWAIPGCKQRRR
jgi:hypothetical protein